jgi:hypothetical protein
MRKPLGEALSHGLRRLKAGPIEVEFDQEAAEVREEVRRIPEVAAAEPRQFPVSLTEELARLTEVSPRSAVMEAFRQVEKRLRELLEKADAAPANKAGVLGLARSAAALGLISNETRDSVEGLSTLRNLAAHSVRDDIDANRARDYVAMADAVLYALRDRLSHDISSASFS